MLPQEDVKEGMNQLMDQSPEYFQPMLTYFEHTYVRGPWHKTTSSSGNIMFVRTEPRYPISLWNVHKATRKGKDKTNNQCESFNNSYKHLVGHTHPCLWVGIDTISQDIKMVEAQIQNYDAGIQPVKRVKKGIKLNKE